MKSVRFDVLELSLVGLAAAFLVLVTLPPPPSSAGELRWLERTYGPDRESEHAEEWIVRDFFRDRPGGVFVDIGASDPRVASNTWYLETKLRWSGLAVDAQSRYAPAYARLRPRTHFRTFFVSARSSESVQLFLGDNPLVASSRQEFTRRWGQLQRASIVPTITLNDLLLTERIAHIDFLSMDIELAEPEALAGFDLPRYAPALVCIEAHPEVRQRILDYFGAAGYVPVGKYLRVDEDNLWFMPLGARVSPFPADVMAQWRKGQRLFDKLWRW
jgi:FkbM family methyltransferase